MEDDLQKSPTKGPKEDQKQTRVKNVKGAAKKHKTEDHVHCCWGYLLGRL